MQQVFQKASEYQMAERPYQVNLDSIQSDLVERAALLLMLIGGVSMWLLTPEGNFQWYEMAFAGSILAAGILIHKLMDHFRLARAVTGVSIHLLLLAAMWLFTVDWVPFLAPLIILISAILLPRHNWLLIAADLGTAVWLTLSGFREYPLAFLILVLLLSGWVARITILGLFTALEWVFSLQRQTNQMLEQTREHRAELSRALKSLEIAYGIQNRMQHDLMIAKKMAEEAGFVKQQFAANISHEIRTPLSLILGFSEIMYQSSEVYGDMEWPPALRRDIYQIYSNSLHLQKMIDDVLMLSKYEIAEFTLRPEPTDITPFLLSTADVARDLFRVTRNSFETDVQSGLPVVEIDQTRVRQVIFNLINNANRFTDRGHICLKARVEESPAQEPSLVISVSDTGMGIPAEKLDVIFDTFYQADYALNREHHGAGLGLALCKQFVEAHHGHIWAESVPGEGSTFSFTIPIQPRRPLSPRSESDAYLDPAALAAKPRLIVTDPDPLVVTTLRRNLPNYDLFAVDGEQSLDALVQLYRPQAVIHNISGEQQQDGRAEFCLPDGTLLVQCSLPSQSWRTGFPQLVDRLSKPINSARFTEVIHQMGPLREVLLVDDDWGFLQLGQRMLERLFPDLNVRTATNGRLALDAMRESRPDLVLMDVIMPEMTGVETLQAMTADPSLADIPVIIVTGDEIGEISQNKPESQVLICKAGGLSPMEVLTCVKAAVDISRPAGV